MFMTATLTTALTAALATFLPSALPSTRPSPVTWVHTLADAQTAAKERGQPILIYCWADGSDYCGKLFQETLAVDSVQASLGSYVCFSAKHGHDGVQEVFERYRVTTLPTLLFVTPDGMPEDRIAGFIPPDDFVGELIRIHAGRGTVSGLRAWIAKAEPGSEDLMEARWLLAGMLFEFGDVDGQDALAAAIRADDPQGKTPTGATILLNDLVQSAAKAGVEDDVKTWDLAPIYAFAKSTKIQIARFQAWDRLLNLEASRKNMQGAFDAASQAFECVPDAQAFGWRDGIARWVVERGEECTSKERKFALQIATRSVKQLESSRAAAVKSGEADGELDDRLARALRTQAWTFHVNGKDREAVAAARRAIEIRDGETQRADVEQILSGT